MESGSRMYKLAEFRNKRVQSVPARNRLNMLFDEGTFVELDGYVQSGEAFSGVITGYGTIGGALVYAYAQDFTIDCGAVGIRHAQKISRLYDLASKTGNPIVSILDSNGLRIDEGVDALSAFGKILFKANTLSGVVPQIALVLGTCAGSATMAACSSDIVILSEKAEFFMASPFLAKEDIEGVGTAANAAKSGVVHFVEPDEAQAIQVARKILSILPANNLESPPVSQFTENADKQACLEKENYTSMVADRDSLIPLHRDFGMCAYTALGTIAGSVAGFVATGKDQPLLCADGADKIARFVRFCDAFSIPVITFVDTEGFRTSAQDELYGSIRSMSKLVHAYAEATTQKIGIITGKAYGSLFTAFAGKDTNADIVYAYPQAQISPLPVQTSVEILYQDRFKGTKDADALRNELQGEYEENYSSAFAVAKSGHIDDIIDPVETREKLIQALSMLAGKRMSTLPKKHANTPF